MASRVLLKSAQAETTPTSLAVVKLTDSFLLITGAGANVLAVLGPDGVLMVDGGSPERSDELLKLVADRSGGKPVQVLFNTCWDIDHTGSNETLGKAGAKIIAHENTKLWLGAEFESRRQKRTFEPHPKAALPNQTFYSGTKKMTFGAEPVEYGYVMQAHTDGDIYVYFPGPNILMAGGVVSGGELSCCRLRHRGMAWPAGPGRRPALRRFTCSKRPGRVAKGVAESNQRRHTHRPWKWACDDASGSKSRN